MFKCIDQKVLDVFDNDYNTNHNLKVKTINSSGGIFGASCDISHEMESSIFLATPPPVDKGFMLSHLKLLSNGKVMLDASWKVNENLKCNFVAEDGRHEPGLMNLHSFGKMGLEYQNKSLHSSIDIDVVNGPLLFLSSVFSPKYFNNNIKIGGSMQLNSHLENGDGPPSIIDLAAGAVFKQKDYQIGIRSTNYLTNIRGTYLHNLNTSTMLAAKVDMSLEENSQQITIGALHKYDQYTTIKTKIDSRSRMCWSISHWIGEKKEFKLTAAATVDVGEGASNKQNVGIGISYNA